MAYCGFFRSAKIVGGVQLTLLPVRCPPCDNDQVVKQGSSLACGHPTNTEERPVVLQDGVGSMVKPSTPKPAARSRLIRGDFGPSDSALAASSGGRLSRPSR